MAERCGLALRVDIHLKPRIYSLAPLLCRRSATLPVGHGDEIVFADANFPSSSVAKHTTLGSEIRCDGSSIPELLKAVLTLMPLDPAVKASSLDCRLSPISHLPALTPANPHLGRSVETLL